MAPVSLDDVASFLVDNPEADHAGDDMPNDDEPGAPDNSEVDENPDGSNADGSGPASDDPEEDPDADTPDEDDAAQKQPSLKFKVPVKGEDGSTTEIEVDQKELIAGYQRHADYTRKTQELSNREREAHELVSRRLDEGRAFYMQEAQKAHALIRTLAALKSDDEMAHLAATNKDAWVEEKARAEAIQRALHQLEQGMTAEQQRAQQQQQQAQQQEFHKAWGVLGQEGIDKPKLRSIFDGVAKSYGVEESRFANVTDPKVVLIMRDALAYRELKAKTATVKKDVKNAPNLPPPRQRIPQKEQANKRLDQKFRSGKAGMKDLTAWIANN